MGYRIKNWKNFQHFRERRPPWIKLYRESILESLQWHELEPKYAKHLVELWLLASESDGDLPDVKTLAYRLRITEKEVNQLLTKVSYWLEHEDINAISERYQCDTPERETERETERDLLHGAGAAISMQHEKPALHQQVKWISPTTEEPGKFDVPKPIIFHWIDMYPAVMVATEMGKAAAWVMANPAKRKNNWYRFLNNWMARCQERGGTK